MSDFWFGAICILCLITIVTVWMQTLERVKSTTQQVIVTFMFVVAVSTIIYHSILLRHSQQAADSQMAQSQGDSTNGPTNFVQSGDRRYCSICDNWNACECPSDDAETKQGD